MPDFDRLAAGRDATLVKALVSPYIVKGKERALAQLTSGVRAGSLTDVHIWGLLGQIVALEDFETEVLRHIEQGYLDSE